jgi:hypothetical protein
MLIFEKTSPGVRIDTEGMTEEQEVSQLESLQASLPKFAWEINLGCGAEPEAVDPEAVATCVRLLLAAPVSPLGDQLIVMAKETGAWFYWRYAGKLAIRELQQSLGEDEALEAVYGDDASRFWEARRIHLRTVMKERFDIDVK